MAFKDLVLGTALLILALTPLPALADKGGNGNSKGHGHDRSYNDDDDSNFYSRHGSDTVIVIGSGDRAYIRNHLATDFRRNCPPGLAKKRNGCLPPGIAKKRYEIGHPLPSDVIYVPISVDLRRHLSPIPAGYQYVQVDKDVLLIAEASKKVIDAVTLLSAISQ